MQTILITGANGFLGQYLSRLLVNDYQVIATGKGEDRNQVTAANYRYESLDFTDLKHVEAILQKHQPHILIHAGAVSKPDECETNKEMAYLHNVKGTEYLLKTAASLQSHFIFLSTDFVFDGKKGMYNEIDEPGNHVNYYGETKLLAEQLVKAYPCTWSIVRTVLVYGQPGLSRQNILTSTAIALKEGKSLKIFNDQVRTPTYVEDLAFAIKTIADQKATGIYHISGEDIRTPYQMVIEVAEFFGYDKSLVEPVQEQMFDQPARRPAKTGFDITKAKQELNYEPTSFIEGLRKTFKDWK
jgi:dTDP-4-dehydrorhamnose reductase